MGARRHIFVRVLADPVVPLATLPVRIHVDHHPAWLWPCWWRCSCPWE
ncbi:MAG TPA: hypothetical protein VFV05_24800 [Methylomirabilota bacterium]|nr:hypothetical protein [Methylomirabilota bacterium]